MRLTKTLACVEDVHAFFKEYNNPQEQWWFRGQADAKWKLIPQAGRKKNKNHDNYIENFNQWLMHTVAYQPDLAQKTELEITAIAQHHGLATCLLDWTFNPMVALYFACYCSDNKNKKNTDGAVYCYRPPSTILRGETHAIAQSECHGFGFIPMAISTRILNQKAAFTIHMPPNKTLHSKKIKKEKLIIPSKLKIKIIKMLDYYGINHATLFPDMDGLSCYYNYISENNI